MKEATEGELLPIKKYLKRDVGNCIYMYIDICTCRPGNDEFKVWFEGTKTCPEFVVMKYYDSISVYQGSENKKLPAGLQDLLKQYKVSMISGERNLVQAIMHMMEIEYKYAEGYVYEVEEYPDYEVEGLIEEAQITDMGEIARLICGDEEMGQNYQVRELEAQLRTRLINGTGRNYIIRESGKIAAHIATYAEFEDLAVTSGLIVHPEYRKKLYGIILESKLVNVLKSEKKRVFTFLIEKRRIEYFNTLGIRPCGMYGKLTLKKG